MRTEQAILLGCLMFVGCSAFQEPLATDAGLVPKAPPADLSALHVWVRRPELSDPPPEKWKTLAPADVLHFRMHDADHVVASLSETGLFASVAYFGADDAQPSVLINPIEPPAHPCDGDAVLIPVFTLGLLPAVCERDAGVYFAFARRNLPDFACPWPQTEIAGWLPGLLSTGTGDWTRAPNHAAFVARIRSCVLSQSDAFAVSGRTD